MDFSPAQLFWGLFFGSLGAGYFIYGKKQGRLPPLLAGIALIVFPYFVSNSWLMVLIGTGIAAVPYFFRG